MAFTDNIVRALLAVGRRVAVAELVAGQALVTGDPGAFQNRGEGGSEAYSCGPRWGLNR